jgi:hypothetical protein
MASYYCARATRGWLAACGTVTALVCAIYLIALTTTPEGVFSVRFLAGVTALLVPALLFFVITCLLTGIPAAAIVRLSEKFRIRAIWFFGCAGAAIGALSVELLFRGIGATVPATVNLLFAGAGLVAGLVYWHVAGRYAGRDRRERKDLTKDPV